MLKESILLVASTGLLIYFITPSEEPPVADPVPQEMQQPIEPFAQTSDDDWGDDEYEESDDEEFVFGEPMVVAESESYEKSGSENSSYNSQQQSANKGSKSTSFTSGGNGPSADNPRPGAPGSIQNPIEVKPGSRATSEDF